MCYRRSPAFDSLEREREVEDGGQDLQATESGTAPMDSKPEKGKKINHVKFALHHSIKISMLPNWIDQRHTPIAEMWQREERDDEENPSADGGEKQNADDEENSSTNDEEKSGPTEQHMANGERGTTSTSTTTQKKTRKRLYMTLSPEKPMVFEGEECKVELRVAEVVFDS